MSPEELYTRAQAAATQVRLARKALENLPTDFEAERTCLKIVQEAIVTLDLQIEVLARLFYLRRNQCLACSSFLQNGTFKVGNANGTLN